MLRQLLSAPAPKPAIALGQLPFVRSCAAALKPAGRRRRPKKASHQHVLSKANLQSWELGGKPRKPKGKDKKEETPEPVRCLSMQSSLTGRPKSFLCRPKGILILGYPADLQQLASWQAEPGAEIPEMAKPRAPRRLSKASPRPCCSSRMQRRTIRPHLFPSFAS